MSVTAKSVIFDIADNHGATDIVGIRRIDFSLSGTSLSLVQADYTAYQTSSLSTDYEAKYLFDTSKSLTGSSSGTSWASSNGTVSDQRVIIVFDSVQTFDEIIINNHHSTGASTNRGAKNVKVIASDDTITSTVYDSSVTNSVILNDTIWPEHTAVNAADNQTIYDEPFDVDSVPDANKIKLTIPAQDSTLANFPFLVNLSDASGKTDFDTTDVFDELGENKLKLAIIDDDEKQCYVEVERWDVDVVVQDGTVSADSSYSGVSPDDAFDGDDDTCWGNNDTSPTWLQLKLANERIIVGYTILCNDTATNWDDLDWTPKDWTFEGSNDGTTWTTLDTVSGESSWVAGVAKTFNTSLDTAFRYYRIYVTDNNSSSDNYVAIYEITLLIKDTAQLWVKAVSLSNTTDNVFTFCFDNSQDDNISYVGETGSTSAQNVWDDDFVFVCHMAQDPSGTAPQLLDSTSNGNDATSYNMDAGNLVEGQIGKAVDFDGTEEGLYDISTSTDFDSLVFTVEATVEDQPTGQKSLFHHGDQGVSDNQGILTEIRDNKLGLMYNHSGTWYYPESTTIPTGTKTVALSVDGVTDDEIIPYFDGIEKTAVSLPADLPSTSYDCGIGAAIVSGVPDAYYYSGKIGELRFSKVQRSADWLSATSDSNVDDFVTFSLLAVSNVMAITGGFGLGSVVDIGYRMEVDGGFGLSATAIINTTKVMVIEGGFGLGAKVHGSTQTTVMQVTGGFGLGAYLKVKNRINFAVKSGFGLGVKVSVQKKSIMQVSGGFGLGCDVMLAVKPDMKISGGFGLSGRVDIIGDSPIVINSGFGLRASIECLSGKSCIINKGFGLKTKVEIAAGKDMIINSGFGLGVRCEFGNNKLCSLDPHSSGRWV